MDNQPINVNTLLNTLNLAIAGLIVWLIRDLIAKVLEVKKTAVETKAVAKRVREQIDKQNGDRAHEESNRQSSEGTTERSEAKDR